jgi:hypothetical protein
MSSEPEHDVPFHMPRRLSFSRLRLVGLYKTAPLQRYEVYRSARGGSKRQSQPRPLTEPRRARRSPATATGAWAEAAAKGVAPAGDTLGSTYFGSYRSRKLVRVSWRVYGARLTGHQIAEIPCPVGVFTAANRRHVGYLCQHVVAHLVLPELRNQYATPAMTLFESDLRTKEPPAGRTPTRGVGLHLRHPASGQARECVDLQSVCPQHVSLPRAMRAVW